jgi:hypothetical protein
MAWNMTSHVNGRTQNGTIRRYLSPRVGKQQDTGENYRVRRFMIVLLTRYCYDADMKKDEMTGHVMLMTKKKNTLRFSGKCLKDASLLENVGRGIKVILK